MNIIPYSRQIINKSDIKSVVKVLKSDLITQGPVVDFFEKNLSEYCGSKFAVCFSSGTAALHAAYFASGIKTGDEVITSPITFVATSNACLYLGAVPVFCDVENNSGNIDCLEIEKHITEKTKAIVPVHFSGNPANLKNLKEIANRHGLIIIEDACHALGAVYGDHRIGDCFYSNMTVFSFHPVKTITTGEGGAVLTNDSNIRDLLLRFRSHGITKDSKYFCNKSPGPWYYEMLDLGYNYRITDIQCSLGNAQLEKIEKFIDKRRNIAKEYDDLFESNEYFDSISVDKKSMSSWHFYPILLKDDFIKYKSILFQKFHSYGIKIQVHYIPIYLHPFYEEMGYFAGQCPRSEKFYEREISLPIYFSLTKKQIKEISKILFSTLKDFKNVSV